MLFLPDLLMGMEPLCFFHVLLCGKPLDPLIIPHGGFMRININYLIKIQKVIFLNGLMGIACTATAVEPPYFVHILVVYDSAWGFHSNKN